MTDPYKVLGIDYNASEQELREAYKRNARMYADNPYKMGEIDRAYDEIIGRSQPNYSNFGFDENTVRTCINTNNISEAQRILDSTPEQNRNAEWFFLQGLVYQKKGRLNKAYDCFETAVNINPSNPEYQNAYNAMNQSRNGGYRTTDNGNEKDDLCHICSGLLCADCCCEAMGGDLIPCC